MAAGDKTQGERRDLVDMDELLQLKPGQYGFHGESRSALWFMMPNGQIGHVEAPPWNSIVEHENGTVTVDPSIWNKSDDPAIDWHGFLRAGQWEQVE